MNHLKVRSCLTDGEWCDVTKGAWRLPSGEDENEVQAFLYAFDRGGRCLPVGNAQTTKNAAASSGFIIFGLSRQPGKAATLTAAAVLGVAIMEPPGKGGREGWHLKN